MFPKNTLENLELKLAQTKKEKAEIAGKIERDFKENYSPFIKETFGRDFLGVSRYISALFQIEKIDTPEKSDREIFQNAVEKSIQVLPLSLEKKNTLSKKIIGLSDKKEFTSEKMMQHSDIKKDIYFPMLQTLETHGILTKEDMLNLSLAYKKTKNILESVSFLTEHKREIVKSNIFELTGVSETTRVENFHNDFKEEIENSQMITFYPRVLKFVGRNYSRLRLKNKVETKKERLKRMFKIAFLKLYRLKYSGIDIGDILQKIENLDDLDQMISLLIKFFEELKQNPTLSNDYVVLDEIDEVTDLVGEAENNEEKKILSEKNILQTTKIVEEIEEGLSQSDLESLLSDDTDLVGEDFIKRENVGVLAENQEEVDEEDEQKVSKDSLEEEFEKIREELFELEDKKRKCFLEGNYDEIDDINDELIILGKKAEKLKKMLGIGVEEFYEND